MLQQTRTTGIILITCFLHNFTNNSGKPYLNLPKFILRYSILSGVYYLPLYYQVLGSSATGAGIR